ncbi:MAG: glycosyltransferase family 9 protein [Anaerolineae bacterium]
MRILLIRPCCIGDVVLATATLSAVRDAYPDAYITWAVGGWSQQAIAHHPALDAVLDTGASAMPVKSVQGFVRFVRQMREGHYDLIISLVRSPLMSLAVALSGCGQRAGIDSNGRGFGYTHRYRITPQTPIHEAQLYLNVAAQLGIDTAGYLANLPVLDEARQAMRDYCEQHGIRSPYIVINPAGGTNPGMTLTSKRWLPSYFAQVGDALAHRYNAHLILLAGPDDHPIIEAVQANLHTPATVSAGELSFPEIGALAHDALLYLGNDTGVTHLASASGARTAMIMGISDPARYAPFGPDSIALWKPTTHSQGGVAQAQEHDWDWQRDGIDPETVLMRLYEWLK